jgi:hypothetical protein
MAALTVRTHRAGGNAMAQFSLVMRAAGSIQHEHRLTDFVTRYTGTVICRRDRQTCIGKLRAHRLNVELAAERRVSLADVCEGHSEKLYRWYRRLYRPGHYGFRHEISGQFQVISSDLLVLDTIVLDPQWRGLKLGLLVARRAATLLGSGCGLVAATISPYRGGPSVPAHWVRRYASDEERGNARDRLREYFAAVGFRRVGRSGIHAMSVADPVPSHAELLRSFNKSKPFREEWR